MRLRGGLERGTGIWRVRSWRSLTPGTSVEAIVLRDGRWAMAYNDLEKGRGSLAISMSDDEGATWK